MRTSRTGPPTTPASGEAPASTVVRARVRQEREPAAERAAAGGGRGVGLLTGGQAVGSAASWIAPCTECRDKATSESSVSQNWTFCAGRTVHRHAVAKETESATCLDDLWELGELGFSGVG
jgi:hypothetical protein